MPTRIKDLLNSSEKAFLRLGALLGIISASFAFYNSYLKPAKPSLDIKFALNNSDEIIYEVDPTKEPGLPNGDLLPAGVLIKNNGEEAAKNVVLGILPSPSTSGMSVEVYNAKEKKIIDRENGIRDINYIDIGTINPGETFYLEKEINAIVKKDVFISELDKVRVVMKDGRSFALDSKAFAGSAKLQITFSLTAENMKKKREKVMSLQIGNTLFFRGKNIPHFVVDGHRIIFNPGLSNSRLDVRKATLPKTSN